ncbi:murein biosynthesis integral membrane protein MurJ [Suttonella sp. R2A3]|nr:murein biosynthesis integral membrane protein MurJ [Suttonella sp. R2A3]
MASRVLGLLRDIFLARYFDTTVTDPFFAALRIPNTLRRFFGEGGFANAFVPVFSATKTEHPDKLKDLLRNTSGTLFTILLVITILGMVFSGAIVSLVAYGLNDKPQQFILASDMLRIMFPYILLISLTAMCGGVLNTHGQFGVPAFTPVLLNVAIIAACLWHYLPGQGAMVDPLILAWAVLLGGVAQLALQLPFLWRLGLLVRPKWGWKHSGVRRIMKLMVPTLFGSSVGQLTILVNTFLASLLATGSISWLYYSDRLVEFPIALIGVALGTVILPKLSALNADDNPKAFFETLDWSLTWGLLIGSAASMGLFVLAPTILLTLFYGGHFSDYDVMMTTMSLRAYAFGAFFWILVKVLAPAFYSRHDTKTPVKAGLVAMGCNIVLALILSQYWAHVGLAGASALSALINVAILVWLLHGEGVKLLSRVWKFLIQIVLANGAMASMLVYLQGDWALWLAESFWWRIGHLFLLVGCGILTYVLALRLLGVRWNQLRLGK